MNEPPNSAQIKIALYHSFILYLLSHPLTISKQRTVKLELRPKIWYAKTAHFLLSLSPAQWFSNQGYSTQYLLLTYEYTIPRDDIDYLLAYRVSGNTIFHLPLLPSPCSKRPSFELNSWNARDTREVQRCSIDNPRRSQELCSDNGAASALREDSVHCLDVTACCRCWSVARLEREKESSTNEG